MIAPVEQVSSPWTQPVDARVSAPKTVFLKDTVCRLRGESMVCQPAVPSAKVMEALKQLIDIVMQLRSPTGGWPAGLAQTPENLAAYVGEETWEFLDALAQDPPAPSTGSETPATVVVPIAALIPHLLWLLASSNYEVMRLLEGVKSRIYASETEFSLGVVRLVPVLSLGFGGIDHRLDLVTQTEPDGTRFIADGSTIKLVENDLNDRPMTVAHLLANLGQEVSQTKPQLAQLLDPGWSTQALSPFQPWGEGRLRLQIYLANMGTQQLSSVQSSHEPDQNGKPVPTDSGKPAPPAAASGFTLDDFADVLEETPQGSSEGILGDWVTFTDEAWVHDFLNSCVSEILMQHLPELFLRSEQPDDAQELACIQRVYEATNLTQGDQALSKHTFVHEPILVADLWLRLRWYLAHCSERVMQLMGGVPCRVLLPGRSWQQGYVHLRPIMVLDSNGADISSTSHPQPESQLWILDLGNGRLLPALPALLPNDAAIALVDASQGQFPLTIGELAEAIDQDIANYAPAVASLRGTGTPVNLHRLESDLGLQASRLTLTWGFTLQPRL
jgi:hypothetical protein